MPGVTTRRGLIAVSIALATAGFAVCIALDPWVYERVGPDLGVGRFVHDAWRRSGDLRVWAVVALLVTGWELVHRRSVPGCPLRGLMLFATVFVAALLAELLKISLRRGRPNLHDGEHVFRPFADRPFDSGQLGLPSSEATIAFAGVGVLCLLYPRLAPVWLFFAAACAAARVASQRHFLSDAWLAIFVGLGLSLLAWTSHRRWIERSAPARLATDEEPALG